MNPQLAAAKELVEVLEQMQGLEERRQSLVAVLTGPAPAEPPKAPKKATRAKAETAGNPGKSETPETPDPPAPVETKLSESDAWDAYNAGVENATTAQKNMIFGILGKQFGIKDEANMKAVITGIVAKTHDGFKMESISKELSKAWAKDVIDYLLNAKSDDLEQFKVPF